MRSESTSSCWMWGSRLVLLAVTLLVAGFAQAGEVPSAPAGNKQTGKELSPPVAQEGVASYYAKKYEGRRTTSGERYRAEKLTAAHPELPFGTLVRVVHADSGKEVVVKVNDRCRKKKSPFIDLSRAAARELGILGKGKARVQIVLLEKEGLLPSVAGIETP